MKGIVALLVLSAAAIASAQDQPNIVAQLGQPDAVYYNAKIVTVDDTGVNENLGTIAEAMAIRNGRVLAVGTTAAMRALAGPKTSQVDLKGHTVLPGLILTHEHPMDWMFQEKTAWEHTVPVENEAWMVKFLPAAPPDEAIKTVLPTLKEMVAKAKPNQWIYLIMDRATNLGWAQETMKFFPGGGTRGGNAVISKDVLDKIAPNNPVLVKNGWTTGVVNTKGLEAIEQVYPKLANFRPNGSPMSPAEIEQFRKNPSSLSRGIIPDVMMKNHLPDLAKLAKASFELWGAYGVTGIASSPYSTANFAAYAYLDRRNDLPIRYAWGYQGPDFTMSALSTIAGILGHGSDYMWNVGAWGQIGTNCTTIDATPEVKARERCNFAPGTWGREMIDRIVLAGGRIATMHTEGDKDIDYLLDAIEQKSREAGFTLEEIRAKRHTFDHTAGAPRPDQIARMKRLGMMTSSQNGYLIYDEHDSSSSAFYAKNYGEKWTCWVVPKQTLFRGGIMTGAEVDKPVPWLTFQRVYDAMTRYNPSDKKVHCPEERSTRNIELKAMTAWAGYYTLAEDRLGTLAPGRFADFVVLDRDYLTVPDNEIPSLHALMTVVGGKTIHLMPSFASEIGRQAVGPVTWKGVSVPYLTGAPPAAAGQ